MFIIQGAILQYNKVGKNFVYMMIKFVTGNIIPGYLFLSTLALIS
jgi:hypothetical protein